jgi:hypothetical protein
MPVIVGAIVQLTNVIKPQGVIGSRSSRLALSLDSTQYCDVGNVLLHISGMYRRRTC